MLKVPESFPRDVRGLDGPDIVKVAAGNGVVAVITRDHRVRHLALDPEYALREQYWTRVTDIAVSQLIGGLCVGLIEDGTCMVSKRALRRASRNSADLETGQNALFEQINHTISSWQNVVQVAVSDAIFALHADGTVSCCELRPGGKPPDYPEVPLWRDVKRIAVGLQCGVAGITEEGRVLVDGGNLTDGLHHRRPVFADGLDARDICLIGPECEAIYILDARGHVVTNDGKPVSQGVYRDVCSGWNGALLARDFDDRLRVLTPRLGYLEGEEACALWEGVRSYALIQVGYEKSYAVALCDGAASDTMQARL